MVNMRSGLGNNTVGNELPENHPTPREGPMTREEITIMMQTLLAQQREETRLLLEQHVARGAPRIPGNHGRNHDEEDRENGGDRQSESASRRGLTHDQRTHGDEGFDGIGCKYKDFMTCRPSTYSGVAKPVVVMDWISEMEMAFATCGCSERQKTIFAVRQLKSTASRWWNTLVKSMAPGEAMNMPWEAFLVELKKRFCTERDLLQLQNEFLNLKKEKMSIDEYVAAFSEKLEFSLHLIPNELAKVDKFAAGLPSDYSVAVRTATTFQSAVWAAKYVENQLKEKASERAEAGEKRKFGGSFESNKKRKNPSKSGGNKDAKWCEKCKKKHSGRCEARCYTCNQTGHLADKCPSKDKTCYGCGEVGHIKPNCPKKEAVGKEAPKKNGPQKTRIQAYNMTLDDAKEEADVASGTFLVNNISANVLFDSGANFSFISHKFGRNIFSEIIFKKIKFINFIYYFFF